MNEHIPAAAARPAIEPHAVRFSGDAGEYFGVWMVNVLLTVITLGLYTPWARRRTVQYFYGHTELAGSPFEFTAPLRRMVIGFLLFAALYVAFELASRTGQNTAVSLMMVAAAALAPWVWGSAMRFRLGHTRWRGLRLQFRAGWGEVYRASWPVFALAALWLVLGFALAALAPSTPATSAGKMPRLPTVTLPMWGLGLLGTAASVLCLIRLEYNYRRLLVQRTEIGAQAGRWKPVYSDFVRVWLASVGVFVLSVALIVGLAALLAALTGGIAALAGSRRTAILLVVGMIFGGLLALFLAATPALAYREARMFQLLWNNIGVSDIARFRTDLRTSAFVWLRIRNSIFSVLTLGFYRPFARLKEYRMKSESVTLHLRGGLESLVGQLVQQQQDGFGDAIGDAVGFDLI
ncbi:MAG: YjgN family protein [Variovorax sp.]